MSKKIQCLIVDDEPLAIEVIEGYIRQIPQLEVVATCSDSISAFQVLNEKKVHLLFLDIQMPGLTGLEFLKSLPSHPQVILTTAHREYAVESYELDIVYYLLKPISFSRFFKSINKFLKTNTTPSDTPSDKKESKNSNSDGSIYVYADKRNVKVFFKDILYIESLKDYVRIFTSNGNLISKDTISNYEAFLPNQFLRIHRSFIVNKQKITAFTQHDIEIGQKEIPIGVSYKKKVAGNIKS